MNSDLRAKPIVSKTLVCATRTSQRQERGCAPAQLNVAQHPKLHKTTNRLPSRIFFSPEPIPAVLYFQYAVLRDVSRIRDRRPVRICDDRICIATGLRSQPLPKREIAFGKTHCQSHNRASQEVAHPFLANGIFDQGATGPESPSE